jgi:hypothetical protein
MIPFEILHAFIAAFSLIFVLVIIFESIYDRDRLIYVGDNFPPEIESNKSIWRLNAIQYSIVLAISSLICIFCFLLLFCVVSIYDKFKSEEKHYRKIMRTEHIGYGTIDGEEV